MATAKKPAKKTKKVVAKAKPKTKAKKTVAKGKPKAKGTTGKKTVAKGKPKAKGTTGNNLPLWILGALLIGALLVGLAYSIGATTASADTSVPTQPAPPRGGGGFTPESPESPPTQPAPNVEALLPHVCDGELFGDALNNASAQQLVTYLPEGYVAFLISSDPGIINGEGTNGSGYLALVESEELVLTTSAGSPTGVGFNQPNQRWNVHVCAIPAGTDITNLFGDWQLGNIQSGGDRAGEQKPLGVHIDVEGAIEFIWTSIVESRTYFK